MSLDLTFLQQQNEDIRISLKFIFINYITLQRLAIVFTVKIVVEIVDI